MAVLDSAPLRRRKSLTRKSSLIAKHFANLKAFLLDLRNFNALGMSKKDEVVLSHPTNFLTKSLRS
ncbi:MAG: hypothetical protein CBB71_08345 [Rhodopirellula sp. TMED11]|nr:MAG: hypothetical protein CBB71_08345 [Rhodopirellula sp. TMED11]